MLRTHQFGLDGAPNQGDDTEAIPNEAVVYVPEENHRNLREAKHQRDLPKDFFNHIGALAGQEDRIGVVKSNNPREISWHLSAFFRTTQLFQEFLLILTLHRCPTNFPKISKKIPTIFQSVCEQIKSPIIILNNFNTSFFLKMSHSKCQNL